MSSIGKRLKEQCCNLDERQDVKDQAISIALPHVTTTTTVHYTTSPCIHSRRNSTKHPLPPTPLIPLPLPQHIPKLLERTPIQLVLLPQIRGQEPIRIADGHKRRFQRVLERFGASGRGGVDVLDAGELEEPFYGGGGHEASAAGGGDELESGVFVSSVRG